MSGTRRIKEVTQQLGSSDQTVRLWTNEFRVFMSPTAAPPTGVMREFNDTDIRLLSVVRDMRRAQRPAEEIHAELKRIIDTGDLPPMPDPPPTEGEKTAYLANVRDQWLTERSSLQRDIMKLEKDNATLHERLADEQMARRADTERLLNEHAKTREQLAEAKALLKLYEEGRLRSDKK